MLVSGGGFWHRGRGPLPLTLVVEAAAQGAALLLGDLGGASNTRFLLAGIDHARIDLLPEAGESINVEARLVARVGNAVRVAATIDLGGRPAGSLDLLLSRQA